MRFYNGDKIARKITTEILTAALGGVAWDEAAYSQKSAAIWLADYALGRIRKRHGLAAMSDLAARMRRDLGVTLAFWVCSWAYAAACICLSAEFRAKIKSLKPAVKAAAGAEGQ